ncbi:MAG: dicarboxylate/amino acid:cation symporter [Lachnospiraceae bacterium]|nr:dicarboxylate/amino acid:cation symporter [Lachnospiraceae bacterium]
MIRIRLSLEEALLSYQKAFGEEAEFRLETGGSFGSSMIRLTIPGESHDPFADSSFITDEDNLMRNAMIRMGKLPRWRFKRGANEILCTFTKKTSSDWIYLITAIVAAIFLGLLVRLSPESVQALLRDGIISPMVNTFLGFLNAVAGPMIFLSVVWGIYSIGDASTFSRIGRRLLSRFGGFVTIMIVICAIIILPLFSLHFGASQGGSDFSQLYMMILNIIPGNLFTPFAEGNTLQILFIACISGIAMLVHGKNTQSVADLSEQLGLIVNFIMMLVSKLVPVFVFGSLFNIIVSSELSPILIGGKFFTVQRSAAY